MYVQRCHFYVQRRHFYVLVSCVRFAHNTTNYKKIQTRDVRCDVNEEQVLAISKPGYAWAYGDSTLYEYTVHAH